MADNNKDLGTVLEEIKLIKSAVEEQKKQLGEAAELAAKMDKMKDDVDADTKQKVDAVATDIAKTIEKFKSDMQSLSGRVEAVEKKKTEGGTLEGASERFLKSDAYGVITKSGSLERVSAKVGSLHAKADYDDATVSGTGTDAFTVHPERNPAVMGLPFQPLMLRDLLTVRPTQSDTLTFMRLKAFTDGNGTNAGKGGAAYQQQKNLKAKTIFKWEQDSVTVQTIATWHPVTRQVIADAGEVRNVIDTHLVYSLRLKEEREILYGAGGATAIEGLISTAAQAYDNSRDGQDDTILDKIRRAITQVTISNFPVTGVVMHPVAWENVELSKNGDKSYLYGSPAGSLSPRIWGVPVAPSQSIDEDDFLVGNFVMGAQLRDREDAVIRVTDSHDDFFIRNMWVILAEERVAMQIFYPNAFVTGSFSAGS